LEISLIHVHVHLHRFPPGMEPRYPPDEGVPVRFPPFQRPYEDDDFRRPPPMRGEFSRPPPRDGNGYHMLLYHIYCDVFQ